MTAKRHHYLPQFVLERFANQRGVVCAFDKKTESSFVASTKNLAAESQFYSFDTDGVRYSLEPWLSQVESTTAPLFAEVVGSRSLGALDDAARKRIASFLAIQFVRGRWYRELLAEFDNEVRAIGLRLGGQDRREVEAAAAGRAREPEFDKLRHLTSFDGAQERLVPCFLSKDWLLLEASESNGFAIGDHPIALQNQAETSGPFGSLGLMSVGIEIYVPLSPSLTLAMWCPSILIDTLTRHVDGSVFVKAKIKRYRKSSAAEQLLNSFNARTPYVLADEQVVNLNRRQLQSAERFIFSQKSDFRDERELLQKTPGLRAGRRISFG